MHAQSGPITQLDAEWAFMPCAMQYMDVVVMQAVLPPACEEKLVQDVPELVAVFAARRYGLAELAHVMNCAHRIRLDPTWTQAVLYARHADCQYARAAGNCHGRFLCGAGCGRRRGDKTLRPRLHAVKADRYPWSKALRTTPARCP